MRSNKPLSYKPGDFSTDRRVLLLMALAFVIGTGATFAAWFLVKLIAFVTNLVWFGRPTAEEVSLANIDPGIMTILIPAMGGLVVGLMARFGSEKIRGHGIPEAIEAILIGKSRLSPKVAVLKPASSAIAIGTGGPFGAEGPIIMTGGAIGSLFAQFFEMSSAERKTLLVAGAAAGMTGIFGTPVAAVLLAVELLLFEWKPRSLIPVIAAVAVASAWRPFLFETGPLFPMTESLGIGWWILAIAAGVGISLGLVSGLLTTLLYKAEDFFSALPIHWMWWPTLGGLAVGLGGLIEPAAMGVGYDVIRALLDDGMVLADVATLLAVKAIIWIIALASGTSGGVLAPLLILGGATGFLEAQFLPGPTGCWALLGMAALMGGTMRAPLTGVLFAVELTGNFQMLLPLLVATSASYAVTVLLLKRSILTEKIARRGRHITREYSIDPFELMHVRDIMVTPADTLPGSMPIEETVSFFMDGTPKHKSYPVVDETGVMIGMVSRSDILQWRSEGLDDARVLADMAGNRKPVVANPDELVATVVRRMVQHDVGRMPVIEAGTGRTLGLLARKDLFKIRLDAQASEQDRTAFFRIRRPA